jgi:hypothetical protein
LPQRLTILQLEKKLALAQDAKNLLLLLLVPPVKLVSCVSASSTSCAIVANNGALRSSSRGVSSKPALCAVIVLLPSAVAAAERNTAKASATQLCGLLTSLSLVSHTINKAAIELVGASLQCRHDVTAAAAVADDTLLS